MHLTRTFYLLALVLVLLSGASAATLPEFQFKTDNGSLRLASLQGKVVYLDYWASWCGPCRESFPWMNEMQARYGAKGLVVVAVNVDRDVADARKFLAQTPANFTVAYDSVGDSAKTLALKGMPSTFLVSRHGEITASHVGFRAADKSKLEAEIRTLLDR